MGNRKVLSKTRFMSGLQCPLQLWLRVNEANASELEIDRVSRARMDSGNLVGEVARTYCPDGVLIPGERYEYERKCSLTYEAIEAGANVIYEAAFMADDVFVAIDILEREGSGWVIKEVKSTTSVKKEHLPDVAVQLMTTRKSGLEVTRAELMHLNRDCRYPDLTNLFETEDITEQVEELIPQLSAKASDLALVLANDRPEVTIGVQCSTPRDCPFKSRCWPALPEHHISTLYSIRKTKVQSYMESGVQTLDQIPGGTKLSAIATRQVRSVVENQMVLESGLGAELINLQFPLAFLDFETISPAIPVWDSCGPYTQVPVQFSCHTLDKSGDLRHSKWLASRGQDPREKLAHAIILACKGAASVVAYNMSFERRCIQGLAEVFPSMSRELLNIVWRQLSWPVGVN